MNPLQYNPETKDGSQEMAAMMLLALTSLQAAISWPPLLISSLFSSRHLKAIPFFDSLAVFCVWISLLYFIRSQSQSWSLFYARFLSTNTVMKIM